MFTIYSHFVMCCTDICWTINLVTIALQTTLTNFVCSDAAEIKKISNSVITAIVLHIPLGL